MPAGGPAAAGQRPYKPARLTVYTVQCRLRSVKGNRKRNGWDNHSIKALRTHLGLTQVEMASRLGTRQQTISEWEKGMYQPRGASVTLLSIVADSSGFAWDPEKKGKDKQVSG
jgi:DNA-binding transcriptional regulator YiaG